MSKDDLDLLDLRVLVATIERPRVGVREHARTLDVARGTVQARLNKLQRLGVITDPTLLVSPRGLGYSGLSYMRLNLAQGVLDDVTSRLAEVPEVLSVDSIAGDADVLCQVVSTDSENLEEVIQEVLAIPGVMRSRTETVLRRRVLHRVRPLIDRLAGQL